MGKAIVSSTLALLGGAGLGAVAMYLLDPDTGSRRRSDIHSAAHDAIGSTGEAVQATAASAGSSARSFASRIADYAHGLADDLTGRASDLADQAGDYASNATDYVQSLKKSGRKSARDAVASGREYANDAIWRAKAAHHDWKHRLSNKSDELIARGRNAAGVHESHPIVTGATVTIGTVSVCALGAGLMYFMDPKQGRARREWVRDSLFNVTRQPVERAKSMASDAKNRARDYASQARDVVESKLD